MAGVQCATCGRAYGHSRAALAAGVQPYSAAEAGPAAALTGWLHDDAGAWWCGIGDCRPAPKPFRPGLDLWAEPAQPWWHGHATKHV